MTTLVDRIRAHPAVDQVLDERERSRGRVVGGGWFIYLKRGWIWSEQTGFGDESLLRLWPLVKEATRMTFEDLAHRHSAAIMEMKTGADITDEVYQDFYEYYVNNGEMPYGVAKARTGDLYWWVAQKILEGTS